MSEETSTRVIIESEYGQTKREIVHASKEQVVRAIKSVADFESLGLTVDTSSSSEVRLKEGDNTVFILQPKELVGRKIVSPIETVEDEIAIRFARSYMGQRTLTSEEVDRLVSQNVIRNPMAAWALASWSARENRPLDKSTSALNTMYSKEDVLTWFDKTRDRNKYKNIFDAASE